MGKRKSRVEKAIETNIIEAVSTAVHSDETVAKPQDIKPISDAVTEEIMPMVVNATNQEPWYQSTIIMGTLVTLGIKGLAQLGWAIPPEYHGQILDFIIAVVPYLSGITVIMARKGFFKKPIGYGPILGWIFHPK